VDRDIQAGGDDFKSVNALEVLDVDGFNFDLHYYLLVKIHALPQNRSNPPVVVQSPAVKSVESIPAMIHPSNMTRIPRFFIHSPA
jgi:hypothetical protein